MNRVDSDTQQVEVCVRLFADLRRYLPPGVDGPVNRHLQKGATVQDLVEAIGIPANQEITAGLNGSLAERTTPLSDGDQVDLFSPMEGG
jgi:molybdopterin converting factor small subunit